jgi:hypothetical protein
MKLEKARHSRFLVRAIIAVLRASYLIQELELPLTSG